MYLENLIKRSEEFAATYGAKSPIMLGSMAGACPVNLSIAVANGGGMGACGALLMQPEAIKKWATEFRAGSVGPFQLNLWIPDAPAARNNTQEARIKNFLNQWGPEVSPDAANNTPPNFQDQCEALLDIAPPVISSIMGLFDHNYVKGCTPRASSGLPMSQQYQRHN